MTEEKEKNSMAAVVDRFEGEYAVLKNDDGDELLWPSKKMPSGSQGGDRLILSAMKAEDETIAKENMAKAVLNEILKSDGEKG